MNTSVQALLGAVVCLVLSLVVAFALATENHFFLILGVGGGLLAAVLVSEGFAGLIAFGLLCPFVLPVPFVRGVPLLASVLALCVVKYILRCAVRRSDVKAALWLLTPGIALFFLWVAIRYGMDPVLPNPKGFGAHVTGFRAYFGYAICFGLVVLLGVTINTREQLSALLRWLGIVAAGLAVMFIPLVFSRSVAAASVLSQFGVFVTTFDNGFLRFVVLPGYGMLLVMLAVLPNLCRPAPGLRMALLGLGLAAVVLGGSRSSVLMLMVMLLCVAVLRWRVWHALAAGGGFVALLAAFYLVGEYAQIREVGLLRILSVVSPRIAYQTDAAENMRWRMARWERAVADIEQRPWVGKGYGGLDNAWVCQTRSDFESAMVDVDVAAGSVHNGYLAAARAFGVPAVAFFLLLQVWHALRNFQLCRRMNRSDPFASDLHLLVFAYVVSYCVAIYFGTDLNDPMVWFWLGLGMLMSRVPASTAKDVVPAIPFRSAPSLAPAAI
ncbi:MAG: O-antigen ligase family protein [Limisphaerales bacterium]